MTENFKTGPTGPDPTVIIEEGSRPSNEFKGRKYQRYRITAYNKSKMDLKSLMFEQNCRFYIFGDETCPTTGRKHVQGYIEFNSKRSWNSIRKLLNCDLRPADAPRRANVSYCSKEDPDPLCSEKIKLNIPIEPFNEINLLDKQKDVLNTLFKQSYREILWIVDTKGGWGKSTLARYILTTYNDTLYFTGGTQNDIASQVILYTEENPDPTVCIFDFSRSKEGCVSYNALESLKNGMINTPKYKGGFHIMNHSPKILVLSNWYPDKDELSADRWNIIEV